MPRHRAPIAKSSSRSSKSSNPGATMEPTDRPIRPAEPAPHDELLVELGPIVNRHGIRGELRLLPHNPESDGAAESNELVLIWPGGRREARRVRGARRH